MSAREFKPGDVALVENEYGIWNWAILQVRPRGNRWVYGVAWSDAPIGARVLPVVAIDPRNVSVVEQLRATLAAQPMTQNVSFDAVQGALIQFADPKPRIEEPTGLGAVVEDAEGKRWIRTTTKTDRAAWDEVTDGPVGLNVWWVDVFAVRVLHEGVTS